MNCALTNKQQESLLIKVYKDLQGIAAEEGDFILNDYIKNFHDQILGSTEDPALALTYAQLLPEFVNLALTGRKELVKALRDKGLSRDALEDIIETFEDLNTVAQAVGSLEEVKSALEAKDAVAEELKKPKAEENTASPEQLEIAARELMEFIFKPNSPLTTTGQQGVKRNGNWTNIKDPEQDFYYDIFREFSEALRKQGGTAETLDINGHRGFKLKIINKQKIAINHAKPSEQRLVEGKETKSNGANISEEEGKRLYNAGLAAVLTDNNGNILFFDENYNVVDEVSGMPIYHNLRVVKKEGDKYEASGWTGQSEFDGSSLQTTYEIAAGLFTPTEEIPAFSQLKQKDNPQYQRLISKATNVKNAQLELLYQIREYITENPEKELTVDIIGISRGVLDIRKEFDTPSASIDWINSDIKFNPRIATLTDEQSGKVKSGMFINVPGHRAIPVQENNFGQKEIDKILALMFDDIKYEVRGKLVSVPGNVRQRLLNSFVFTNSSSVQIILKKDEWLPFFKGKKIDITNDIEVAEAKAEIAELLTTKYKNPRYDKASKYNINEGRYRFDNSYFGKTFETFEISDNILSISTDKAYIDFVKENTALKIRPNENNQIVFLNGYFQFSVPKSERKKIDEFQQDQDFNVDEIRKEEAQVSLDFFEESLENKILQQLPKLDPESVKKETGLKIGSKSDINPTWTKKGGASIKKAAEKIFESLSEEERTNTSDQEIKSIIIDLISSGSKNEVKRKIAPSNASDTSYKKPVIKEIEKGKGKLSGGQELYMGKIYSMNSSSEEIKKAKDWFENQSGLAKYIGVEEMFDVVNSNAWAEFVDSGIKLYAGSDYTVLYHEAFHGFTQHFLSKTDKVKLYEETLKIPEVAAKIKGRNLSRYDKYLIAEEHLAEDFRQYMLSEGSKIKKGSPARNTLFRRILNFLKRIFENLREGKFYTEGRPPIVDEIYNKLRVGELNQYSPSEKNAFFGESALHKTIDPVEGETTGISDEDAILLVESMDGVISDLIDEENTLNGDTRFTSALFTAPERFLPSIYEEVKNRFIEKRDELASAANQSEGIKKERLIKKINLLDDAIKNFGNSNEGLIAFHLEKSPFLSGQTKNIDKTTFEKTKSDIDNSRFDKSGNDLSMFELSSNQVLYLVKSLKDYDPKTKKKLTNELGFPKLIDYRISWRKLVNLLSENNGSPVEIKKTLEAAGPSSPWIYDLLDKLGDPNTEHDSVFDLWTQFWSAFYMANWGLYQVSVSETSPERDSQGEMIKDTEWEIQTGYASAVFRQVERDFRSAFKAAKDKEFIIDTKYGNILDYSVLDKYKGDLEGRELEFLNDIGIPLSDVVTIREGLDDVRVDYIFDKLSKLQEHNYPIYDIIKALKDKQELSIEQSKSIIKVDSEGTNVNKILNLEARYSGLYANSAVTTADGNVKYEQSQMSSLGIIQRSINTVKSFDELIAMPHMSYLKYDNNPFITSSIWLKSLFEFNPITQTFGNKKEGVNLEVDDLSGTQTIIDNSYAEYDYSSTTAKSDKYTRLLQDIYSSLLGGRFSTMVHADKNTTLSLRVSNVDSGPQSQVSHLYVDPGDFSKLGATHNLGIEHAYDLLLPYLESELTRIKKVKTGQIDGSIPIIPGYTVPDSKGVVRGADFSLFKGIFTEGTLEEILKAGSIENLSSELQDTMIDELELYFNWSSTKTKDTLERMIYVDPNMKEFIQNQSDRKLTTSEIEDIMIKSYTVNTFIHHADSFGVIYGDLAQYNMEKEEFHKRNASIASTGRVFRTDSGAYDYVNNILGRPWEEKTTGKVRRDFNGILNSVVFEETTIPSKMIPHYKEELKKHFKGKYKGEKLNEVIDRILSPYTEMDEGDAQGWINFDTYRILSKLSGRWSINQERLFRQMVNDPSSVMIKDIIEYFPPRKYQYFGPLATEGLSATALHKFSLFPLIPSAVKGKNLEVLHNRMIDQNIDYALYKSGSKVSTITSSTNINGDILYADKEKREVSTEQVYTKNPVYLQYLKDQLDINSDFKGKVIFSTQLRKLIEEGLIEGGVPADFNMNKSVDERREDWTNLSEAKKKKASEFYRLYKTYEEKIADLIEYRKAELRKEVGWTEKELASGKGDIGKLVKFIQRELDRQDLADHEIDFIQVNENGELVHDLSISLSAAKIERALNAIVNNRLIRQKVNGEALVQLSSSLLEASNASDEERARWGTNDLNTYRKDPKTGKTLGMDVKIALQSNFQKLTRMLHKDGEPIGKVSEEETLRRLNETIQDPEWRALQENLDMITMVGVRIPVQGLNSMEFMTVWEFLPKEAGNVIVPPSEIVAKSGSDFDIDKLTIMMPSISIYGRSPSVVRETNFKGSYENKLERVEELKNEIRSLNKDIRLAQKDYRDALKSVKRDGLTEEEKAELSSIYSRYDELSRDLTRQIDQNEFNITRLLSYDNLTNNQSALLDQSWKEIQSLHEQRDIYYINLTQELKNFGSTTYNKKIKAVEEVEGKKVEDLSQMIDKLKRELDGLQGSAIENNLMFQIRDILELPHNFISLITPNDTSLVKEPLADPLSEKREYKVKEGAHGPTTGVDPTRALEPAYNIYKHESNSVGKDTLGLGAVDNTYNTIFNRVGAYMNPEYYTTTGQARRATILMEHNTLEVKNGKFAGDKGISLSHLYDVYSENKIADIINQLMNGWVDVAKDAWIFDIQGNKQVSPVLLFLIQAGVPLKTAVYFVSNPLVKEYVKEQKIVTSVFSRPLGEAGQYTMFRTIAKSNVFDKMGLSGLKGRKQYLYTLKQTQGRDFTNDAISIGNMDLPQALKSEEAKAAFLHYLELEEMAKGVRDIKMKLNYDTAKSTTLFDAQRREADLEELLRDSKFPRKVIEDILNESPIGSFRIAPFQLTLWGGLFNIRNNEKINNFLIDELSNSMSARRMVKIFGDQERYVEEFKNDFVVKIFVEAIKDFDPNSNTYKGITINKSKNMKQAKHLNRGAAVVSNEKGELEIFIDPAVIDTQYNLILYSGSANKSTGNYDVNQVHYDNLGLAKMPVAAFRMGTKSDYYKFVIEREYIRATNPFAKLSQTKYFKFRYDKKVAALDLVNNEKKEEFLKRVLQDTYEELIRDMALDNTLNYWKLFMSDDTAADRLFELKEMHPTLEKDYSIVADLIISEGSRWDRDETGKRRSGESYTNLALRDNRVNKDILSIYHKNLVNLADSSVNSIPIESEADIIENQRIADFFRMLPLVAFLQSGLNTSDRLSMVRAMPNGLVTDIIESKTEDIMNRLNSNEGDIFLMNYYAEFNDQNSRANISTRRRLKNYHKTQDLIQQVKYDLIKSDTTPDHTMPMNFEDGEGGRKMRSEFKGKSTFDLILSGDRTGTSRSPSAAQNVKKGDIVAFTKEYLNPSTNRSYTRSALVKATSDEYPVDMIPAEEWSKLEGWTEDRHAALAAKNYVQFTFELLDIEDIVEEQTTRINPENSEQLENMIKNNPKAIFVLEGADSNTNGFYVEGLGLINSYDNIVGITLRNNLNSIESSLWGKADIKEKIQKIDESLNKIEELYKQDGSIKFVFLSETISYGTYLLQRVGEGPERKGQEIYDYLTRELYKRFGYKNKLGKLNEDVQELMQKEQGITEYTIQISEDEISEAYNRLTCK